jgi:Family of unknown function (DUF5995)
MKATTIDEVITRLEGIVSQCHRSADPLGIFALVYLGVTQSVREGVRNGSFHDSPRMERLDVIFANRYIDAYDAYRQGQPCTQAWQTSFDAARRFDLLILQHLLMGMNAHINLDLGIAAAEAVTVGQLKELEADFNAINAMLVEKIDAVQDKLSSVSPMLFLLDWFGKKGDERFAAFSLVKARTNAWKATNRLSQLSETDRMLEIKELDGYVALLNKIIVKPGVIFRGTLRFVKWFELKDVGKILDLLR